MSLPAGHGLRGPRRTPRCAQATSRETSAARLVRCPSLKNRASAAWAGRGAEMFTSDLRQSAPRYDGNRGTFWYFVKIRRHQHTRVHAHTGSFLRTFVCWPPIFVIVQHPPTHTHPYPVSSVVWVCLSVRCPCARGSVIPSSRSRRSLLVVFLIKELTKSIYRSACVTAVGFGILGIRLPPSLYGTSTV